MIVHVERRGEAPEQVHAADVPLASRLYEWMRGQGIHCLWISDDHGVIDGDPGPLAWVMEMQGLSDLPPPCCYGSDGE